MSHSYLVTSLARSLHRQVGETRIHFQQQTKYQDTFKPVSTSRTLNTKTASKRNLCKPHLLVQSFRVSKRKYSSLKERITFKTSTKSQTRRPCHRRSIFRVLSHPKESGYQIFKVARRQNLLEQAVDSLPTDVFRHLCELVPHETFYNLPLINRRVCGAFEISLWHILRKQRLDETILDNTNALWAFASTRGRVGPCFFGRQLSMQASRASVEENGSFEFASNARMSSPRRSPGKRVGVLFDRIFDFQESFLPRLRLPRDSSEQRFVFPKPESAFRISSVSGLHGAIPWQKIVLTSFAARLNQANFKRAPKLMATSTLGEKPYLIA